MNVFIAYGRISSDIEMRYTQNNMAVARFSIAVNRKYQNQDKKVDFFNMNAFSKIAENIERFFRKGSRIAVRCHAQQEQYTRQDGTKVDTVGFVVDDFDFVETKSENMISMPEEKPRTQNQRQQEFKIDKEGFIGIPDGIEEELPFR